MSRHRTYARLPEYCTRESCAAISMAIARPKTAKTVRRIMDNICVNCAYNITNLNDTQTSNHRGEKTNG